MSGRSLTGHAEWMVVGLAIAATGTACAQTGAVYYVAEGARVTDLTRIRDCDRRVETGPIRFRDPAASSTFHAVAAGDVTLKCATGRVTVRVRPIHRLEIEGPAELAPQSVAVLAVRAYDRDGHDLLLGDSPTWSVEGGDVVGRCNHMLGRCPSAASVRVRSPASGAVEVTVQVAGATARRRIPVESSPLR
ncbi:MAG: hypothetical protein D6689_11435 [Deltaproteobacteria bacterium]|nr:MAG: hypothetical protein D6689_11435 [Deltaproteobacteria bacterium]